MGLRWFYQSLVDAAHEMRADILRGDYWCAGMSKLHDKQCCANAVEVRIGKMMRLRMRFYLHEKIYAVRMRLIKRIGSTVMRIRMQSFSISKF